MLNKYRCLLLEDAMVKFMLPSVFVFLRPHRSQLVIQRGKNFRELHSPNIISKAQILKTVENLPPDWSSCQANLAFAALVMIAHT